MKKIFIILLAVFIIIQFFRPEKNVMAGPFLNDISTLYPMPATVDNIMKKACYDCHSNNTIYPWYNNIQPVAGWLSNHIAEGKGELNFNEFASYRIGKQYRKLLEVKEQVEKDEMPLNSYKWIHADARLTASEKEILLIWADSLRSIIRNKYPADSLVTKREKRS